MTTANDRMIGGNHYHQHGKTIQHWDIVAMHDLDYFQGQVTKYVMRWKYKNGIEDLEKAAHYLAKYIEVEKAKPFRPDDSEPRAHGYVDQDRG